jgi:hypothetical protein
MRIERVICLYHAKEKAARQVPLLDGGGLHEKAGHACPLVKTPLIPGVVAERIIAITTAAGCV